MNRTVIRPLPVPPSASLVSQQQERSASTVVTASRLRQHAYKLRQILSRIEKAAKICELNPLEAFVLEFKSIDGLLHRLHDYAAAADKQSRSVRNKSRAS